MNTKNTSTIGYAVPILVCFAALTSCGGGGSPSPAGSPPTPTSLTISSGNNQSGTVGQVLSGAQVVKVSDQTGNPLSGQTITWTVTAGGGSVDHASSQTAADGTASAHWTLGTQAGSNTLNAAAGALRPAAFSATGVAGPLATITIAQPGNPVEVGDVLQLGASGTDAYGNPVELPALTWTSTDSSIARVTADAVLLVLGLGPVSISARSGQVSGSLPLTIDSGITISLGAEETVFRWMTDRCEDLDVPDVPAHVVRLTDGSLVMIDSDAPRYYASFGADFSSLKRSCSQPALASGDNSYAQSYDNWEWLHSVYFDGSTLHALIHNEFHDPIASNCSPGYSGRGNPCWYNAITYAFSTDGGTTFTHATPPGHVIAPPPVVWDPTGTPPPHGYFNPSNIVHGQDGFYYVVFPSITRTSVGALCAMRTQTLGDPTSWRAWNGSGFNLQMTSPYTGPAPANCTSVVGPIFGQPSLTYNTYLGQYMMFGMTAVGGPAEVVGGFFYALSPDLLNWTPARFVRAAYIPWCCFDWSRIGAISAVYPSIIDHSDATANFERPGQTPYLYYTRPVDSGLNRDLVRVPMTITNH